MSRSEEDYFAQKAAEKKQKKIFDEFVYMHCPKCGKDLSTIDMQGVKIDRCSGCQGIWLDKGELEELLEKDKAQHGRTSFFGMLFGDLAK